MQFGKDNAGMSLVSVTMAMALAGITTTLLFSFLGNNLRVAHYRAIRADYELARQTIRSRIDCSQTIATRPSACESGGYVSAKDNLGNIFISDNISSPQNWLGAYHIRISCIDYPVGSPTEKALIVEARAETEPGSNQPIQNPLKRGEPMPWTELFAVPLCRLSLNP